MKKFFKYLVILSSSVMLITLAVVLFALQSQPSTEQMSQIDAEYAQKSQQLLKRIVATLKQEQSSNEIVVTQQEIHGLTALLHRAFPHINSHVVLSKTGASIAASIELPLPQFIRYLNLHAYLLPSRSQLQIDSVSFGRISVDGAFAINAIRWLSNHFVKEQLADKVLAMIDGVDIDDQRIKTQLVLSNELFANNNQHSLLTSLRDELALFGNVETISFYYQSLNDFAMQQEPKSSIAVFVRYLFDLAKTRSSISEEYLATTENQAALMALIIYFGADRFETLVGDVIIREYDQLVVRNRLRNSVSLQGRVDLQKHFIYSMALQLFSTHGASDAIGEFKEFLDTNQGGSGFSFADLQADRAGTRLASIVTKSEQHAKQAQALLANVDDQQLLPSINGLKEGLHQQGFVQEYQDVSSSRYQQALLDIDNRLKSLPVYQLGWE